MRFGISEISWMLPKILRIRRELVLSPLVVLRGASIALVAMCFPALREAHARARSAEMSPGRCRNLSWSAGPAAPPQCLRSVRRSDPVPGRTGKAPGARHRAAEHLFVG